MRPVLVAGLLAAALMAATAATAQQAPSPSSSGKLVSGLPVESVTVLGVRPSDETIKSFVDTRAAPTPFLGKIARWSAKICPQTAGMKDVYANYITKRIRDVATAVGAPVATAPCRPNIEIVFTTTPQALLDTVHKNEPELLGYYDSVAQGDQLARMRHPIQAWYATATTDFYGQTQVENGRCTDHQSDYLQNELSKQLGLSPGELTPCAKWVNSSGFRVNNGLSSGFFNILIVAEPAKLLDYEIGSLADYITMLALSQPASLDSCQQLPSISNMLAQHCATVPIHITDGDLAYLRALYKMPDGTGLGIQRDEMRFEMTKTLVTDKGN